MTTTEEYIVSDIKQVTKFIDKEIGIDFEVTKDDDLSNSGSIVAFDITSKEDNKVRDFISKNDYWLNETQDIPEQEKILVKDVIKTKKFPLDVVYKEKQYIILSKDDVVLWAGNMNEFLENSIIKTGYYDNLYLTSRKHDLYLNNNDKIIAQPNKILNETKKNELEKIIIEQDRSGELYRVYFEKDQLEACGKSVIFRKQENGEVKLSVGSADVEEYEELFKNELIAHLAKNNHINNDSQNTKPKIKRKR